MGATEPPVWRKASYSFSNGNCAEVANLGGQIGVRDSKDPDGPALRFPPGAWASFISDVKRPDA